MNEVESQEATARELVAFAKRRGVDLSSTFYDFAFFNENRFIVLWRKEDKVLYNIQGPVNILPDRYKAAADHFRGIWSEAGALPDLEQAFEFLKAWLIDKKELDDLPPRCVKREGHG